MKVVIDDKNLNNIADSIRLKNGKTDKMTPAEMVNAINEIEIGGGVDPLVSLFLIGDTEPKDYIIDEKYLKSGATLRDNVFNGAIIKSLTITQPLTDTGISAFSNCDIGALNITVDGIINSGAFEGAYVGSFNLKGKYTNIGEGAFNNARISGDFIVPDTVTEIGDICFDSCSFSNVTMGKNVTFSGSFQSSENLKSVIYKGNITDIAYSAFSYCNSLIKVDFSNCTAIPKIESARDCFDGVSSECKVIVPDSLYSAWIESTNWAAIKQNIVKASEVTA